MRYHILALDYDGTLATHGTVDEKTIKALEKIRESGRQLVMVTGRQVDDLLTVFPYTHLFVRIVAENGAVLYNPATRELKSLAPAIPPELQMELARRGVKPLSAGHVILATREPHEKTVMEVIRDLGLEHQIIFNKGAVMILPPGVNKASGLEHALVEVGFSFHNVVGFGDAENDHAFLSLCECSVAVQNALESLKKTVDIVTDGGHGDGIQEIVNRLLDNDLRDLSIPRHNIKLGTTTDGETVVLPAYGQNVLLCGMSGSGKSTLATSFLERLTENNYQFCVIDPEGDYDGIEGVAKLGDNHHAPSLDDIIEQVGKARENLAINLLAIRLQDRPAFFESLFARLQELRARLGRPHWLILDEAHHILPTSWQSTFLPTDPQGLFLITVHPDHVAPAFLKPIDVLMVVGQSPEGGLRGFGEVVNQPLPDIAVKKLQTGEALMWCRRSQNPPFLFQGEPPKAQRRRHRRKYANGALGLDRNFYFKGPKNKLNLRAQNLHTFIQLAEGVDDDTWMFHLRRGDYTKWFRDAIKDSTLADRITFLERDRRMSPKDSRNFVKEAIEERYTAEA